MADGYPSEKRTHALIHDTGNVCISILRGVGQVAKFGWGCTIPLKLAETEH
jgi:hypothetical protein